MTKEYLDIDHCYDVWHVSKGKIIVAKNCIQVSWYIPQVSKKKLSKAAKYKDCELINDWVKSITNHMYWCAASSQGGEEMVTCWRSLINHLCDQHEDCYHTNDLGDRRK